VSRPLLESFGRTLLDVALRTTPDEVNEWYKDGYKRFKGNFSSRITKNLACVYAGLKLVEKLCIFLKLDWTEVFPIDFDKCVDHLVYAVKEFLLDGGTHNKSIIEESFEVMARMGLKHDRDYIFDCAGRHLCLHLKGIYDRYTKYRKDYAILGEVLRYADFRKQLDNSGYVIKQDSIKLGGKTVRVRVLDFEKLQSACDVEEFRRCRLVPQTGSQKRKSK
jgi:hypothetical protein